LVSRQFYGKTESSKISMSSSCEIGEVDDYTRKDLMEDLIPFWWYILNDSVTQTNHCGHGVLDFREVIMVS